MRVHEVNAKFTSHLPYDSVRLYLMMAMETPTVAWCNK
jgi:hypothetical protein